MAYSRLSKEQVDSIVLIMRQRFMTGGELIQMLRSYGYNGSIENFLELLDRNHFPVYEETITTCRSKYKILVDEDIKWEEEITKDVKRRILETVSC